MQANAGNFDCHADVAVQCGAHCPMEHIQWRYTGSHWMLPSAKCLRHIAPAAAMVGEFIENTQKTNKTQILASNYGTNQSLVDYENCAPRNGPSLLLIDATSCVKMWDAMIGAEELAPLSSYQALSADKNWRSY